MSDTFTAPDGRVYEARYHGDCSVCRRCAFDFRHKTGISCARQRPSYEPVCRLGWYWAEITPPVEDPNPL